jgi:TPR repeat protein
MFQHSRRAIVAIAALAALTISPACSQVQFSEEDWSSGRHTDLIERAFQSPMMALAITQPAFATTPDQKTLAGIARRIGFGAETNLAAAEELLAAACDEGQLRACRDLGKVLLERREYVRQTKILEPLPPECLSGQADACPGLGGATPAPGNAASEARAIKLFDHACENGILHACADLAVAYGSGDGVAPDVAKTLAYAVRTCADFSREVCENALEHVVNADLNEGLAMIDQACEAGGLHACHWGGYHRFKSKDTSLFEKGVRSFEAACEHGFLASCDGLINAKLTHGIDSRLFDAALAGVEAACFRGYVDGCIRLGYEFSYTNSPGLSPDPVRVLSYNESACEFGYHDACRWVAQSYRDGKGTAPDPEKAAALFRFLCDQQDGLSCQDAAQIEVSLSQKAGTLDGSPELAAIDRTCELGDGLTCRNIAWAYAFGEHGRPKDLDLATAHFAKGCDLGEPIACIDIGSLHDWNKFGFAEDKVAAMQWYQRACDLGDEDGCALLAQSKAAMRKP